MKQWRMNKADLAAFFNVAPSTVTTWTRQGCPFVRRGSARQAWVFDAREVVRWYVERAPRPQPFDPDAASPKERKDWFDSEHRRRQLIEKDQTLIPRAEVEAGFAFVRQVVRDVYASIPAKLAAAGVPSAAVERSRTLLARAAVELDA